MNYSLLMLVCSALTVSGCGWGKKEEKGERVKTQNAAHKTSHDERIGVHGHHHEGHNPHKSHPGEHEKRHHHGGVRTQNVNDMNDGHWSHQHKDKDHKHMHAHGAHTTKHHDVETQSHREKSKHTITMEGPADRRHGHHHGHKKSKVTFESEKVTPENFNDMESGAQWHHQHKGAAHKNEEMHKLHTTGHHKHHGVETQSMERREDRRGRRHTGEKAAVGYHEVTTQAVDDQGRRPGLRGRVAGRKAKKAMGQEEQAINETVSAQMYEDEDWDQEDDGWEN